MTFGRPRPSPFFVAPPPSRLSCSFFELTQYILIFYLFKSRLSFPSGILFPVFALPIPVDKKLQYVLCGFLHTSHYGILVPAHNIAESNFPHHISDNLLHHVFLYTAFSHPLCCWVWLLQFVFAIPDHCFATPIPPLRWNLFHCVELLASHRQLTLCSGIRLD